MEENKREIDVIEINKFIAFESEEDYQFIESILRLGGIIVSRAVLAVIIKAYNVSKHSTSNDITIADVSNIVKGCVDKFPEQRK